MGIFDPDFSIEIQMDPTPKGRPRMTRFGHCFTPKKTRDAEDRMRLAIITQAVGEKTRLLDGPLEVCVQFTFASPKSLRRASHTTKPDIDNLVKSLDALNGLVWVDDSQIQAIRATKHYGERGMVRVQVWELCTREQNEKGSK